jgi:hypothetical protein
MFIPVISVDRKPLMPTTPSRARRWIASKAATPFWVKGVFCVRLNRNSSNNVTQEVCVGIDPGSKREAFTVKSKAHTYINILADAVTWVKDKMEARKNMRRGRRYRNTPCRKNRTNKKRGGLSPSTKARWQLKLRISNILRKMFPVSCYIVEDVQAKTMKGKRCWNTSFSPIAAGKTWFYVELAKIGKLETRKGFETFTERNRLGLKKSTAKLAEHFDAHNVDSWVLANMSVEGHDAPDNRQVSRWIALMQHRRQLHYFQPSCGGVRKRYGGTMSLGYKKGSITKHPKHGLCYVGGNLNGKLSLHSLKDGKRLCQNVRVDDMDVLAYSSFRFYNI